MYTYSIKGQLTYNAAENEEGFETVDIEEVIEIDDLSTSYALEKFMQENTQYDFFGSLKNCDAETGGKIFATYKDQNEGQTIDIELINE